MKNKKGLFIKDPNFFRVPRKKKKQIPRDKNFCSSKTTEILFKYLDNYGNEDIIYKTKMCPFYTWKKLKDLNPDSLDVQDLHKYGDKTTGYCNLLKNETEFPYKNCGFCL